MNNIFPAIIQPGYELREVQKCNGGMHNNQNIFNFLLEIIKDYSLLKKKHLMYQRLNFRYDAYEIICANIIIIKNYYLQLYPSDTLSQRFFRFYQFFEER